MEYIVSFDKVCDAALELAAWDSWKDNLSVDENEWTGETSFMVEAKLYKLYAAERAVCFLVYHNLCMDLSKYPPNLEEVRAFYAEAYEQACKPISIKTQDEFDSLMKTSDVTNRLYRRCLQGVVHDFPVELYVVNRDKFHDVLLEKMQESGCLPESRSNTI